MGKYGSHRHPPSRSSPLFSFPVLVLNVSRDLVKSLHCCDRRAWEVSHLFLYCLYGLNRTFRQSTWILRLRLDPDRFFSLVGHWMEKYILYIVWLYASVGEIVTSGGRLTVQKVEGENCGKFGHSVARPSFSRRSREGLGSCSVGDVRILQSCNPAQVWRDKPNQKLRHHQLHLPPRHPPCSLPSRVK